TNAMAPAGTAAIAAPLGTIGAAAAAKSSAAAHTKTLGLRNMKYTIAPANIEGKPPIDTLAPCTRRAVDTGPVWRPNLDHVAGNIRVKRCAFIGRALPCARPGLFRPGQAGCDRVRRPGFATPEHGELCFAPDWLHAGVGNRTPAALPRHQEPGRS